MIKDKKNDNIAMNLAMYDALIKANIPEEDARAAAIEAYKNGVSRDDTFKNLIKSIREHLAKIKHDREVIQKNIQDDVDIQLSQLRRDVIRMIYKLVWRILFAVIVFFGIGYIYLTFVL